MVMQYPEPRIPTKAARTEDSTCTADIDMNFSAQPLPCLWGYLGLGSTGSLTAQLFPQPSRPKHPQPSSLCSPMNTAAGMSTWEHSKQTTPFLLVAQSGQTKYTLGNAFSHLASCQSVCTGDSDLHPFNTRHLATDITNPRSGTLRCNCRGNIALNHRKRLLGHCYI